MKIYIGEYSTKFNTNISMLWLHKNDYIYNFSIKKDTIRKKFILGCIALNSILIFNAIIA